MSLLKEDCGISFLYKIAAENEIRLHTLREIHLDDFSMRHDFDFIWDSGKEDKSKVTARDICDVHILFAPESKLKKLIKKVRFVKREM